MRSLGTLSRRPVIRAAEEYFDAIRQWAIWTREQGFDQRGYTRAFVEHSRKNIVSAGRRWTSDIERAIAALTPARWAAIQQVLRAPVWPRSSSRRLSRRQDVANVDWNGGTRDPGGRLGVWPADTTRCMAANKPVFMGGQQVATTGPSGDLLLALD